VYLQHVHHLEIEFIKFIHIPWKEKHLPPGLLSAWKIIQRFLCFLVLQLRITKIIKSLELEGTFKGRLAQLSCTKQGLLQLDRVAQNPVQPDLECVQGQGIHHISGHPVPMPYHPHCKRLFPYILPKSTFFRFEIMLALSSWVRIIHRFLPT